MSEYTAQQRNFLKAYAYGTKALNAFSVGLCPGCEECMRQWGIDADEPEEVNQFNAGIKNGNTFDEGGFSWQGCDICNTALGGTFQVGHYLDRNGDLCHIERVCVDCLFLWANGDVPDVWDADRCRYDLDFETEEEPA